jgi:hypothetical protein
MGESHVPRSAQVIPDTNYADNTEYTLLQVQHCFDPVLAFQQSETILGRPIEFLICTWKTEDEHRKIIGYGAELAHHSS